MMLEFICYLGHIAKDIIIRPLVLLIDNYDSFTYMLRDFVRQCGQDCTVVRNDEMTIAELLSMSFDSIILSPGPKTPASAGVTMDLIQAVADWAPILGICLGHQAIGRLHGAALRPAAIPMHGKTCIIRHGTGIRTVKDSGDRLSAHPIFNNIPEQVEVMRYHSLILEDMAATDLQVIAETISGEVMGIAHPQKMIAGLQFHPESVLTPYGLQMMRNWFDYIRPY